jgi:hypothetical protein
VRRAIWKASKCEELIVALRGRVWDCVIDMLNDEDDGKGHARDERTPMNQFPLHIAVEEGAPAEVVRLLLSLYVKATGKRAKFSMWVLGTKTRKGRWRAPVSLLVGAKELLVHGHMPVHTAALVGAAPDVIDMLVEANPEAATARARGLLPLHIALLHGFKKGKTVPTATIEALLRAHPDAIRMRAEDSSGNSRLPLHLATISNAPTDVMELLLAAYPGAVDEPDAWGHRPVHYGLSHHSSMRVVRKLLSHDGHHRDHSVRAIAEDLGGNQVGGGGGGGGGCAIAEGKVTDHHEGQYWNHHWNHRARMISQKRWGKSIRVGGSSSSKRGDEGDAGGKTGAGGEEGKYGRPEEDRSDTSSSSSSSGSSSGSSGSSDDDDSSAGDSDSSG